MSETPRKDRAAEWICRVLISFDIILVAGGYIAFFQAKYQLITPLIPYSALYEVTDIQMKAGLITTIGLFAGLWFYFFRKRTIAIILLGLAAVSYEIALLVFNK